MAVITKKIGNGRYAYLVTREGRKVIHKYLGTADNPEVVKIMLRKKKTSSLPKRLQVLFWDTSPEKINLKKNARYIIERLLDFGDLDAVEWLQMVYPVQTISDVLNLSRNITEKSRNFWKIWFGDGNA